MGLITEPMVEHGLAVRNTVTQSHTARPRSDTGLAASTTTQDALGCNLRSNGVRLGFLDRCKTVWNAVKSKDLALVRNL